MIPSLDCESSCWFFRVPFRGVVRDRVWVSKNSFGLFKKISIQQSKKKRVVRDSQKIPPDHHSRVVFEAFIWVVRGRGVPPFYVNNLGSWWLDGLILNTLTFVILYSNIVPLRPLYTSEVALFLYIIVYNRIILLYLCVIFFVLLLYSKF